MSKMYLMSGISGSGKTTFAKEFAEENDLLYLNPDEFYKIFHGDERIHENAFEVWIALFQAIHVAETNGRDCIIDTNALTVVDRVQFLNWFPDFDEHHLIYVSAPQALCMKNNAKRHRVIPEERMERFFNTVEVPSKLEDPRWTSISFVHNESNNGWEIRDGLLHLL